MKLEMEHTHRGFARADFKDLYGIECSIQKSSLATDDAIWLGVSDPKPLVCVQGEGWQEFPLPEGVECFGRMHLNREQVKLLLPVLQYFVETGELPGGTAA